MADPKRMGASRRNPRPAKCVREKLTDRILAWMNQKLHQGEPSHFARDVAKAMDCSVGSAAQGLHYLFCLGFVQMMHVRNRANVYWLTAKVRAPIDTANPPQ